MKSRTYLLKQIFHLWIPFICLFWLHIAIAQTSTERVFDENFKERYDSEKYQYEGRNVVGHTRSGSGNYEEYENKKTEIEEENNKEELTGNVNGFKYLNWVFIVALILAVIYLVFTLINEGGTSIFNSKKNTSIIGHEEITVHNIEETDIESLIDSAEKNADYRLAIRFYHMLVLKNLSLKSFIKLEEDKTNEEYVEEIKSHPFSGKFRYTSYLYDYIWYGEFPISLKQYYKAKENFVELIQKVS